MTELKELLEHIEDSYKDFVDAICHYAQKSPERLKKILNFVKDNPNVKSSDVVRFVSDQPDFHEDAAYMKVC